MVEKCATVNCRGKPLKNYCPKCIAKYHRKRGFQYENKKNN